MSELSDPAAVALPDDPSRLAREGEAVAPGVAIDGGRLSLAVVSLVLVSASIYLALRLFQLPAAELDAFLASNALDPALRKRMLVQLFAAMLVPLLASGLVVARFRGDGVHWLALAAQRVAPLMVVGFLPALLNYRQWYSKPLPYLVLLLGVVLLLERLLVPALRRTDVLVERSAIAQPGASRAARHLPLAIVVFAASCYTLQASYFTILRHQQLGTAGFDLGIFDNLMYNAMHLRPFKSPVAIPNGSYLSNHAEYGMFLFVPLYALFPRAETLLILQSTFIGFAAVPLYFFAATQISRPLSATLACAYLFYAPLHGPNYYDFHWMPQSMLFFFWLFYAIVTGRRLAVALLSVVICSIREDAAFGVVATGLFLVLSGFRPGLGAVLAGVSSVWFVLVKFVIMPWAGPWWFANIYEDLVAPGERGYGSVIKTILVNPNYFIRTLLNDTKATYAMHLLAPLAFLSVRHPALWVLMVPGFIVSLMTTGYLPTTSIAFQYTTHWIPFLFAAAAIALRLRRERLGAAAVQASVLAVCFGVLCHSYVFGSILQHNTFVGGFSPVDFRMDDGERQRYRDLVELTSKIPREASVAATELEVAHVSNRLNAYTLKVSAGHADYLFINRPQLDDDSRRRVRDAFARADYGLVARKGEFFLLKKRHVSPETTAALSALGLTRMVEKPRHHDAGSLIGPGGNCIAVDLERGTETFVRDCDRDPKQRWQLSLRDGRLQYRPKSELCLGVPSRRNGEQLRAMPCGDKATAFAFDGVAIANYSNKCVDLLGGNQSTGAKIGVWDCAKIGNQEWAVTNFGEVRLRALSGTKCWTIGGDAPGTALELRPCDGSESQRFTFSGNRIRHRDKCLDLRSDKPASPNKPAPKTPRNGWHLQLHPCDADQPLQEFHFSGPIKHRNVCVDSLYSNTADGSAVAAWECVGNNNQVFDVHF